MAHLKYHLCEAVVMLLTSLVDPPEQMYNSAPVSAARCCDFDFFMGTISSIHVARFDFVRNASTKYIPPLKLDCNPFSTLSYSERVNL